MKKTNLVVALCLAVSMANAQIITTIAGNGTTYGFSGDGGAATAAELYYPEGVAFDASGNMYIADYQNQRVRKVTTAGVISTFAGNGFVGYSGDGGQATAAELNYPSGLAVDAAGNLYILDQDNQRVRKVTTAGIISTFAGSGSYGFSGDGGQATAAELSVVPTDVALDAAGNLYICDQQNNRIRKVNTAGIISTFAGSGTPPSNNGFSGDGGQATAAKLNNPDAIALDAAGNLYIADRINNRIRKVNTSGVISTVAGYTTTNGFSGDGGAATSAELYWPSGVAVDVSGNMYISDTYNNRIRKVNTSGIISTFAGDGTGGYSGDCGNATAAELYQPDGVTVDAAGNLYIADQFNSLIRKVWANWTNAGPNEINQQDPCTGNFPGVQIGTAAMTGIEPVSYAWTPGCHFNLGHLSSCTIAQPISSWTNTTTPKTYTLYVTVAGCTATTSTVQVTAQNACGGCCGPIGGRLAEQLGNTLPDNFSVYPNPSSGTVTLSLYDVADYIRIIDMQGKVVYEKQNTDARGLKLDIASYNKGIYFVLAKIGDKLEKQKLVVE